MNPLAPLDLQPQDKVVVLEKEHDRASSPWIERTYYVGHVEPGEEPRIHVMDEWGHDRKAITLEQVVDVEKARDPIMGVVEPDIWDRFQGDPKYRGKPVRLVLVRMSDGRISGYEVPLWPEGNCPDAGLPRLCLSWHDFVELGVRSEKHAITSMPAYGWCNRRSGDTETRRRRIYRTARNRITKVLHGARSKWRQGAVDKEPA